nr:MAG TPA: hypothetical protein [Caudoviricetes sp.]
MVTVVAKCHCNHFYLTYFVYLNKIYCSLGGEFLQWIM